MIGVGNYSTLRVRQDKGIYYIQMYRPEANNTINNTLIDEMVEVLEVCKTSAKVVVLQGLDDVFCFGADFKQIAGEHSIGNVASNPDILYDLWLTLATGPFISIAQVKGKANAGGVGFVASCDIVLCEERSEFSLSELLFGLMPACVLPFLIRRIGNVNANYMTLMTQPISAKKAFDWGLVNAYDTNIDTLLRKHLLRLMRLDKDAVSRYKHYMNSLHGDINMDKSLALEANHQVFNDEKNLRKITTYIESGKFPWEL